MTDEALVSEIVSNNDTKLFGDLYDRFSKVVYNKCYSFVRNEDEAKDLTQDIFLKLFVKISSYNGESKFSTWLYSFTYNHCVNYVSRNPVKKYEKSFSSYFEIENYPDENLDISNFNENEEAKLNKALSMIPEKDRSILVLKYHKDLSMKKIEDTLGLGSSAVKMRIKRAKERLAASYVAA